MSSNSQIIELLEFVKTFEAQPGKLGLSELSNRLGSSIDETTKLLDAALKDGLIIRSNESYVLTKKGRIEFKKHRERYVHDEHLHKSDFLGRLSKFFEGHIEDWQNHWRHGHGFDNNSLKHLYEGIDEVHGRIEDVSSLSDLRQGEKAVMAFVLGGHRLVTRLADMGLIPGSEVTMVRSAPLKGPIEVSIRGVSLALGRGVASKIFVKQRKQ